MRNPKAKVSDPNKFVSCPGSDVKILYSSKVLPTGEIMLTKCGEESISERINAEAKFTDISYIINRLQMGDRSVLRDGAVFGDFITVPKSLAESLQIIIDGEKKFMALPLDTRAKFGNSYYQFIMSAGSDSWINKLGLNVPAVPEKPVDEVNKDES